MRLKLTCLALMTAGLAATALPASAQSSRDTCRQIKSERQSMGAVLGGLAGGLIGNQSAARGVRDEGTALGLVVGAIAGSQLASGDLKCAPRQNNYQPYNQSEYGSNSGYSQAPSNGYGYPYGYPNSDADYGYPTPSRPYQETRINPRNSGYSDDYGLAGAQRDDYNEHYNFAGRECADAKQITRLPDGTEIHKPVEACRTAHYGEWSVED